MKEPTQNTNTISAISTCNDRDTNGSVVPLRPKTEQVWLCAGRTGLFFSGMGFVGSRSYSAMVEQYSYVAPDTFIDIFMSATHIGFCLGAALACRTVSYRRDRCRKAIISVLAECEFIIGTAAVVIAMAVFLWLP